MSTSASRASNVLFSDDLPEACCSITHLLYTALTPISSDAISPAEVSHLQLEKVAFIFSPRNDTKYFHSTDTIYPSPKSSGTAPPPSIRSYLHEQDLNAPYAAYITPLTARFTYKVASSSSAPSSSPAASSRSILKSRTSQIRLAASVEEGTLNNKEAARLVVSGKRPRLFSRDSFQLAMIRKAAAEESASKGKGKERATEETVQVPGSDDSIVSEDGSGFQLASERDGEDSEEEEIVEADGALMTGSLVDIILNGAEDLLTLEEAYATLTLRLRTKLAPESISPDLAASSEESVRIAIQPIRNDAPAMVRALQRDLGRLLGKVPNSEWASEDRDSSPFRALQALRDDTTSTSAGRLTPSPSPPGSATKKSPQKRQGYTEAEVRYRREASGVGAAALRFLALLFHARQLYSCFSDADLASLLDQVMIIPRTPKMPTPNPKRTYYLSIVLLAQIGIPAVAVTPAKDRIVRAIEAAMADNLGAPGLPGGGKEGQSQTRKEGFHAVVNVISTYPSIFLSHYVDLLGPCLKGMTSPIRETRHKSAAAAAAFASSKINLLASCTSAYIASPSPQAKDEWLKAKTLVQKMEYFVVSQLKAAMRIPGKSGVVYGQNGEKKMEANALEQTFKDTIGTAEGVVWACAAWSVIVCLMGGAYASSGLNGIFDHIMDRSLQPSNNTTRPLLARIAWNHAIHAYLSAGMTTSFTDDNQLIRSYKPFQSTSTQDISERLHAIQLPLELALEMANSPNAAQKVLQPMSTVDSQPARYIWQRAEKSKRHNWMVTCGSAAATVVYAYTGMALYHRDQPVKEIAQSMGLPSSDGAPVPESDAEAMQLERLDQTWDKVARPILAGLLAVKAVDRLKMIGWQILLAITSSRPTTSSSAEQWSLDNLLATRYLDGQAFETGKEVQLLSDLEKDAITPSQIPAWGRRWVMSHFDSLLGMLKDALTGVQGVDDIESFGWVRTGSGESVIPVQIVKIWCNLLKALHASRGMTDSESPRAYTDGLKAVISYLIFVWDMDPSIYLPINCLGPDGCLQNANLTRITLFANLLDTALDTLGKAAFSQTTFIWSTPEKVSPALAAFGTGSDGKTTATGILLSHLLRTKSLSQPVSTAAQTAFNALLGKLFNIGGNAPNPGKLLGDMTNGLPWLFENDESVQLDIWRLLASQWKENINTQRLNVPEGEGTSTSNHTGILMVSLLLAPFRNKSITSLWHSQASQIDLEVWKGLLEVTVKRFRAKGVESNGGVLDAVSMGLAGFFAENPRTSSSTISVSCLSTMIPEMTSALVQQETAIVPLEFLKLLSDALFNSYPTPETLATGAEYVISPAVDSVITGLTDMFNSVPSQYVSNLLDPEIRAGQRTWLGDEFRVSPPTLEGLLDKLYCSTIDCLTRAITSGNIPATGQTLDDYIDLIVPRLSRALSNEVLKQFQRFWRTCFEGIVLELSEGVKAFLLDVTSAVPGLIKVEGLEEGEWLEEGESERKYPHSLELANRSPASQLMSAPLSGTPDVASADEPMLHAERPDTDNPIAERASQPVPIAAYEADLSTSSAPETSMEESAVLPAMDATLDEALPVDAPESPSPNMSDADSERVDEQIRADDVFGPSAMVAPPRKRGRPSKKRALGPSQSAPEISKRAKVDIGVSAMDRTVIISTQDVDEGGDTEDDEVEVSGSAAKGGPNIFNRLLHKATSLGFFSPSRTNARPGIEIIPATNSTSRASRKRTRGTVVDAVAPEDTSPTSSSKKRKTAASRAVSTKQASRPRCVASTPSSSSSRSSSEVIEISDDDEEDELILSPETARKRREEEAADGDLMRRSLLRTSPSRVRPQPKIEQHSLTQGRFDDAPDDHTPQNTLRARPAPAGGSNAGAIPNPSPARTNQQARVLSMVEEAARAKAVVESLDFEGVMRLLRHVNELRDAATMNLQERAVRERGARR